MWSILACVCFESQWNADLYQESKRSKDELDLAFDELIVRERLIRNIKLFEGDQLVL